MNWANVDGAEKYLFAHGTNRGVSSIIWIKYAIGTNHRIFKSVYYSSRINLN